MSTSPKVFEVPGQSFASMRDGLMKPPGRELIDQRLAALTRIFADCKDPKQKAVLGNFVAERSDQNDELDKIFERWEKDIRLSLEAEHEQTKAEVIKQLERIEQTKGEIENAQNSVNAVAEKCFRAEAALRSATEARDSLSPYATKQAVERAAKAVAEAEARVDEFDAHRAACQREVNRIVLEVLPKLHEELLRLTGDERRAASALSGAPYQDDSGLMLPGGSTF